MEICFQKFCLGSELIRCTVPSTVGANDAMCTILVSLMHKTAPCEVAQFATKSLEAKHLLDYVQKWAFALDAEIRKCISRNSDEDRLDSNLNTSKAISDNVQDIGVFRSAPIMNINSEILGSVFSQIRYALIGRQVCKRFRDDLARNARLIINVNVQADACNIRRSRIPSDADLSKLNVAGLHELCKNSCVVQSGPKRDIIDRLAKVRDAARGHLNDVDFWKSPNAQLDPDLSTLKRLQELFKGHQTRLKFSNARLSVQGHQFGRHCEPGREQLEVLSRAIRDVPEVAWLDLKSVILGDGGVSVVAAAAPSITSLTRLDLPRPLKPRS